jgi:predicted nucleotidyltransferase
MEYTKNEMPEYAKHFFNKLSNYLDTKLYFYGSIQRNDYYPKSSDIDVDLFTDNVNSTISKLQHFLGTKRDEFKKFVYKLHKTNKLVFGYKIKYKDLDKNFVTEISIYDEKYKAEVILEHNSKSILPFYISWLLIILKYFYYDLNMISKEYYKYFKRIIINYMVEGKDCEFITIAIPKDTSDE